MQWKMAWSDRLPTPHVHSTQAENNYAHLDKEALAIVFGVKWFYHYLCGRKFTILSDHKPLKHIFSENKGIPTMASSRVQRWALTLGAYDYSISFKPGQLNASADGVSQLPLPLPLHSVSTPVPADLVLLFEMLHTTITCTDIKKMTNRDPVLSLVYVTTFSVAGPVQLMWIQICSHTNEN